MKYEFDQKRADRDAALYNTDGRFFDVEIKDDQLELIPRPGAEFSLFSLQYLMLFPGVFLAYFALVWLLPTPALAAWMRLLFVFGVVLFVQNLLIGLSHILGVWQPQRWIFDRKANSVRADKRELFPLSQIATVRALKRGRDFRLSLILRDGRQFPIGWRRFGGKEHAWRNDAARIAQFLNLPLEIPPF